MTLRNWQVEGDDEEQDQQKLKMVRPINRSLSNVTGRLLPPSSVHGMWGRRKTSCDGLANKKQDQQKC